MKKYKTLILSVLTITSILLSSCGSMPLVTVNNSSTTKGFDSSNQKIRNTLKKSGLEFLKLHSVPEGATVIDVQSKVIGVTPIELLINTKIAQVGDPIVTLKRDGYESSSFVYDGYIPTDEVIVELTPIGQSKTQSEQQRVSRDNPGVTDMERTIIRWNIDSDPRGARVFWRVVSSIPNEVKNTNENYLGPTPYEETRAFNIPGLTYENSNDVTIEIKLTKTGYADQIKRFNARMALDQQEISSFFELVEK